MGNLLDPLLALLVQDDGESFVQRHALNFIGFTLTDDPANNRINVEGGGEGGGGVGTLAGDVEGNPDENIVTTISGDGEGAAVRMLAAALLWDPGVSPGEAEISVSGTPSELGALQFIHDGKRALLANGDAPELGNDTGINRLLGGLRLTTRSIAVNTALDTLIKDAIGWINASTERQVTLPPASAGRVLLLPFVGPSAPTLKRLGAELINGVASNYTMEGDAAGGLAIAISDGANWVARTIRTLDTSGLTPMTRAIHTTAPLTGGGDLTTDRTLGLDTSALVPSTRAITVTAPLTGGGSLAADRAIGLDPLGYVAPARTIATTAPLTGGGDLSTNRTIGLDTSGLVLPARTINTTAPLTGGGDLTTDRTLGVSAATAAALGVVQLAGNLAGTAAAPFVTGLRADTIPIQDAAGTSKGVWVIAGLRIGDGATPTEKLEVLGSGQFGSGAAKVTAGGLIGSEATAAAIWLGLITRSATNYVLLGDATQTRVNAPAAGRLSLRIGNAVAGELSVDGLRLASDGAAPVQKLEVVGNGQFGSGTYKITLGGFPGFENSSACLWMGTGAPSTTNYSLYQTAARTEVNCPSSGGKVAFGHAGVPAMELTSTGLRLASDGAAPTRKLEVVGDSSLLGNVQIGNGSNVNTASILGGIFTTTRTVSADLTIDTTSKDLTVFVDATAAIRTVTLPTPLNGRIVWIKRIAGTNNVVVNRSASAFIEASGFIAVWLVTDPAASGVQPYLALQADGANWRVMRHFSIVLKTS